MTFFHRARVLKAAVATAAVAAATATLAGTAFAAGDPAGPAAAREKAAAAHQSQDQGVRARAAVTTTPTYPMMGVHKSSSELYMYFSDRQGGFEPREHIALDYSSFADIIDTNHDYDADGYGDGTWFLYKNGRMDFSWFDASGELRDKQVGKGWNIYNTVLSPGDLGGATETDVIGRDKDGVLWSYLSYPDGTLTKRARVGGGWNAYTQIAGQGDLSGDGKTDIVARDKSGALWLYKGTGNYKAPFASRTRIGGGWNTYDRVLSVGDLDSDGKADLIARKPNGDLFRYSGTGSAQAPFAKPVKIGHGFQIYNLL